MKRRHGFTLIELIVVIAIIGVLAAILVPALIGYVKRSRITTNNSSAKQIYNALNVAMVEMEAYDLPPRQLVGDMNQVAGSDIHAEVNTPMPSAPTSDYNTLKKVLFAKVSNYFRDVSKIDTMSFRLTDDGCEGVGIMKGKYPGSYPMTISVDIYDAAASWDSDSALTNALK